MQSITEWLSKGLTDEEARQRLIKHGPNEINPERLRNFIRDLIRILLDPMGIMLLILGFVDLWVGDTRNAIALFIAWIPITAVDVILDFKSRKALRSLQKRISSNASVIRSGRVRTIPARSIVPGDLLILEEGSSLLADGTILEASGLLIDESALTGESLPVDKMGQSEFFSGTSILQGRGIGLVMKTGLGTRYGNIAKLLKDLNQESSPLQRKIRKGVFRILIVASLLAIGLFLIEITRGQKLIIGLVTSLTFALSAIPEEFPLVFTLYLAMGAWRLAKKGVLVKSLPSVETLGSVDVICTDKTGTLTEGRFELLDPITLDSNHSDSTLSLVSCMACEPLPVDLMDKAIYRHFKLTPESLSGWELKYDHPFDPKSKTLSHAWFNLKTSQWILAMKGAMEGVLDRCNLTNTERARIEQVAALEASKGRRILALASRDGEPSGNRLKDEAQLQFRALLVFSDPVRSGTKGAITDCQKAGIEIKMLTGDHLHTAHAIADETGILHTPNGFIEGEALISMSETERKKAYLSGSIFSRVTPEQKYEMIKALKAAGKTVAMTGDGINDAPALRLADIGISMGIGATDAARSAARMILVKSDFSEIAGAVLEGRRIFRNLQITFGYLIAFHIPIVVVTLLPSIVGWIPILKPIHIIILELIVHPVSAFTFENLRSMNERIHTKLIDKPDLIFSIASGTAIGLGALLPLLGPFQIEPSIARGISWSILIQGNLFLVLAQSIPQMNHRVLITLITLTGMSILFAFHHPTARFLEMNTLSQALWLKALAGSGLCVTLPFLMRLLKRNHDRV